MLGKLTLGARKTIARWQKKIKRTPIKSPRMRLPRTKTRLSPIGPLSPLISLRPRLSKKTSVVVKEAMEALQPLRSMLLS